MLAANNAHGSASTVLLTAQQTDAVNATAAAKTALLAIADAAGKTAITAYDNAVAAQALLVLTPAQQTAANAAAASAKVGVDAAVTGTSTVTYTSLKASTTLNGVAPTGDAKTAIDAIVDADTLYAALASDKLSVAQHTALAVEAAKIPTYGSSLVTSAEKELAVTKAGAAVTSTKAAVALLDDTGAGKTVAVEGDVYVKAVDAQKVATDALNAAKTADIAVTAAKAVVDQFTSLNKSVTDATAAVTAFNNANSTKVAITALSTSVDATAKQDVFYFPTKVSTATDITIGGTAVAFGAGDAIVLGSGYTFNSGAVSTGNSNVLEFFLVKGATGTQVVVESDAFGNASTVVGADGTVTASPNAAVITLTGVTADHLQVANGVISYV